MADVNLLLLFLLIAPFVHRIRSFYIRCSKRGMREKITLMTIETSSRLLCRSPSDIILHRNTRLHAIRRLARRLEK